MCPWKGYHISRSRRHRCFILPLLYHRRAAQPPGEGGSHRSGRGHQVAIRPHFGPSHAGYASMLWRAPIRLGLWEGAMAMPVTRYAKSGDVHIAYQVFGSGPIDLVFVPGFVSHIENYWDQPDLARWLPSSIQLRPCGNIRQARDRPLRPRVRSSVVGPAYGRCPRRHGCRGN